MARAFLIVSALFAGAAAFTPTPPGQSLRSLGGFKQVQREQSLNVLAITQHNVVLWQNTVQTSLWERDLM